MKELFQHIKSNSLRQHPHLKIFLIVLVVILIVMVIFSIGMAVGFVKGQFSERWDRHYMEVMGGPRSPFSTFPDMNNRAPSPHGTTGQVISYNNDQLVVKGPGDIENVIIVSPTTTIRQFHEQGTTTEIKAGSWLTAIGSPDENGRLVATFIRIMPAPAR